VGKESSVSQQKKLKEKIGRGARNRKDGSREKNSTLTYSALYPTPLNEYPCGKKNKNTINYEESPSQSNEINRRGRLDQKVLRRPRRRSWSESDEKKRKTH